MRDLVPEGVTRRLATLRDRLPAPIADLFERIVPRPADIQDTISPPSPWEQERDDLLRGIGGAFLFGIPFLYTMEVWWRGNTTSPARMLVALSLTYAALIVLSRVAGFRANQGHSWSRTFGDSVEALALGTLMAAISLFALRRATLGMGVEAVLGRIILLGMPFSLGVGIASSLLSGQKASSGDQGLKNIMQSESGWHGTLMDAGATVLGATLVSLSIAPTDEIPMIASALSPPWQLGLMALALTISYIIVFEASFGSQAARLAHTGIFQTPISETIFSYLVAFGLSALMLWFFQLLRVGDPWSQWLSYTIVMSFPAAVGGAAGRVAL